METITASQTISWWGNTGLDFSAPKLRSNLQTDVCVVGGGIAGLTTAYLLLRAGRSVVVLDARHPVAGETERTTAHLASAIDDRFYNLERWHGAEGARLAAESHAAAIATIGRIVKEENIGCDFQRLDGYLFCGEGDSLDLLEEECRAARRAGLEQAELVSLAGPAFLAERTALRFPDQAQFDPVRYLHALVVAIQREGGHVYADTRVAEVKESGETAAITEDGHSVRAKDVVVTTNSPINDRVILQTKIAPYRTYVIAGAVPAGSVPAALYWDTKDPYHYVRLASGAAGYDTLIVGGEDHKTGQVPHTDAAFDALEQWTQARFPMLQAVTNRWSGQIIETIDGLAFIGRYPGGGANCFVATGDSGMGMTHGTLAGLILSDLIVGKSNPWAALYDPARKTVAAGLEFARENFNVARQYLDWGRPAAGRESGHLAKNSGCVIQRGVQKVAVYRDAEGALHELSAICPHLGCIVRWNETEHTWDCPCHGSRYEATGAALNGPTSRGLSPL
jgi:glycine/D-amino acid oxidase-like deaminating enzyme/nitrite reductase/ring-hydroxylating ferredoxin subunit